MASSTSQISLVCACPQSRNNSTCRWWHAMPGASEESEFAIDCNDILEAFLHDMSALDRHQQKPKKCGPVTTVSTAPVVQIPKTVKKRRLNPSWLKRKRDLEALRAQSEALETRKEFLLRKRSKLQGGCSSETVEQQEQQRETLALEKHKCEGALGENAYLKGKLQAYVNLSGALQTVFTAAEQQQQQLKTMSMAVARALRTESGAGYQLRLASPSVFDLLEERVNRRFRELEASFVTNKLAMTSADTEFVQVYYANAGRRLGTVEFKRAQLLPFDETIISTTILSIIEVGGFPDDQDTRVVKRSSDVFAMDSRLTVYLDDGGSVNLNNHSVMKRFLTPTGIVLMLESISDWTADLQDSGSWTHTTDEGGCFVISSYSIDGARVANNALPGVSQLRSKLILKPGDPPKTSRRPPLAEARTINNVVIPSFREIIQSRHQYVENALFDCIRENTSANAGARNQTF